MRLTATQQSIIRETIHRILGPAARVYLFGSRVDDQAKRGDIDLYIETDEPIENRAATASRVAGCLQLVLGDQKIDVLIADSRTTRRSIHDKARATGIAL